jgi:hypothetical protein
VDEGDTDARVVIVGVVVFKQRDLMLLKRRWGYVLDVRPFRTSLKLTSEANNVDSDNVPPVV